MAAMYDRISIAVKKKNLASNKRGGILKQKSEIVPHQRLSTLPPRDGSYDSFELGSANGLSQGESITIENQRPEQRSEVAELQAAQLLKEDSIGSYGDDSIKFVKYRGNISDEGSLRTIKHTASTSAIPQEVIQDNYNKILQGQLHPQKHSRSVRREITEQRIQENVRQYNSTVSEINTDDLFVGHTPHAR